MEVTHNENMDTHAVIGGAKVRSFGISDNAEFITMLSEGLYSDKMMAVVREVMCNAHDAHVSNKCLDTPIRITLNQDKLIISDSGKGIHDDAINSIYCVYGNSTKTHNGEENGGFGLGSKAPFAYTTHFTVISKHAGRKIIYAVSRGSSETQGKPDMREMANVPTTETGLEVSLPIVKPYDVTRFEELIRIVAYFGEMNISFNGEILKTLSFKNLTEKYMIVNKDDQSFTNTSTFPAKIYVRYGTVIYPIEPQEEFIDAYTDIQAIVANTRRMFIVQAKPNTIAVTPSRESLSMTIRTKETLKGIFQEVASGFKDKSLSAYKELLETFMSYYKSIGMNRLRSSMFESNFNQHLPIISAFLSKPITTSHDIAKLVMVTTNAHCKNDSIFHVTRQTRFNFQMEMLCKYDPDKAVFYRTMKKIGPEGNEYQLHEKMRKIWNTMLMSDIKAVIPKELMVYFRVRNNKGKHNKAKISTIKEMSSDWFENHMFNSSHMVVAHNIKDMNETCDEYVQDLNFHFGFLIPRKKGLKDLVESAIQKAGYVFIDGCLEADAPKRDPNAPKKPSGYTLLSSVINPTTGVYLEGRLQDPTTTRVARPMNLVVERTDNFRRVISDLVGFDLRHFLTLVPNTVVVSNQNTYQSLKKKGGFSAIESFVSKVYEVFLTEPDFIRTLYDEQKSRIGIMAQLYKFKDYDKKIDSLFQGRSIQTPKVLSAIYAYKYIENRMHYDKASKLKQEVREAIANYKDDDQLAQELNGNVLLAALDLNRIYHSVSNNRPEASKQMSLLHLALG